MFILLFHKRLPLFYVFRIFFHEREEGELNNEDSDPSNEGVVEGGEVARHKGEATGSSMGIEGPGTAERSNADGKEACTSDTGAGRVSSCTNIENEPTSDTAAEQQANSMSSATPMQVLDHFSNPVTDDSSQEVSVEGNELIESVCANAENSFQGEKVSFNGTLDTHVEVKSPELSLANVRILAQWRITSHADKISLADFKCLSRKFNLDLTPKLLFAAGSLIELLIKANISHYLEIRTAERILTLTQNKIVQVPCSRADVFNTEAVSVMEKRILMKFLSFSVHYDENPEEYEAFSGKPFIEFLRFKKLSKNLQHYVVHAIAMVNEETDTLIGLYRTKHFVTSLGRYSNSPFVWVTYGVAELPQAFCRMSAVFGGTYSLRRSAKFLKIDKEEGIFNGIISTQGQEISAKLIVMEKSYLHESYLSGSQSFISRAILISDRSLQHSTEDHVTLLTVPPGDGIKSSVRIIELGPSSVACPMGLYVVHMTTTGNSTAENDLQPAVNLLFNVEEEESK